MGMAKSGLEVGVGDFGGDGPGGESGDEDRTDLVLVRAVVGEIVVEERDFGF